MKMHLLLAVLLMLTITGCSSAKIKKISLSPSLHEVGPTTFAIPEFEDIRLNNKEDKINAKHILTDAFETAFMDTSESLGYKIVERRVIQKIINELKTTYSGNYLDKGLKEIGKFTNADALILGEIREFKAPNTGDTACTRLSFSIKIIDIETGELLLKGSISRNGDGLGLLWGMFSDCKPGLLEYSEFLSAELVDELISKVK